MKTTIQEQDGNIVAILEGSLDSQVAAETEKAMRPLKDVEGKDIIIDCTDLDYISSAGLRIFLSILNATEEKDGHMYIKNLSPSVQTVFDMTGFTNIFEFK